MFKNEAERIEEFKKLMMPCISTDRFDEKFIDTLKHSDFFKAPASIRYHGNYEGGLFEHSFMVAVQLVRLTNDLGLQWQHPTSPLIVGMFHDLCKIDEYMEIQEGVWDYKKNKMMPGHGEKSVMLLQQHIPITKEELSCIRWHMGAFDDKENWNYYGAAIENYPNVLFTHTADMIASRIKGI